MAKSGYRKNNEETMNVDCFAIRRRHRSAPAHVRESAAAVPRLSKRRGCGVHRLIEAFDDPALAAVLLLVIYVYIRVTAAWIAGVLGRYAGRAADPTRGPDD